MKLKSKSALAALLMCTALSNSRAQGTWTPLSHTAPDYNQGVMILLTDGSVLAKTADGGGGGIGATWNRLRPDVHGSYVHGTWSTVIGMAGSRLYFSAQVLKDGSVYVAGGEYGSGRASAEVYLPNDDMWFSPLNTFATGDTISDANSEILPDGRVLQAVVISGSAVSHKTYLYDPKTYMFTAGPHTIGLDNESSWVKLKDNSILFADIYATTTERYIPATNTWVHDADLPATLYDAYGFETGAAFLLPDGRAFFMGSTSRSAYYTPTGTTSPGTWTMGPDIPDSLGAPDAAAAMMPNGKILCAFAHTPTLDSVFHTRTKYFEFDYQTDVFTPILTPYGNDSEEHASYISNMLVLPDGSVLYANQGDDQYFVYTPDGTPLAAGKPTVSDVYTTTHCDTFIATGTLFNGISEGAGYGDDWQMATNYPIVRLSRHDSVFYASTYNWNSTGVMRGAAKDTTQFVLPAGLEPGTYQLQVVANGIASAPYSFTFCETEGVASGVTAADSRVHIYPNPASEQAVVEYTAQHAGAYTISLTDLYGRRVVNMACEAHTGTNATTVPLTGVAKGMYTVTVRDNEDVYTTRIVVK